MRSMSKKEREIFRAVLLDFLHDDEWSVEELFDKYHAQRKARDRVSKRTFYRVLGKLKREGEVLVAVEANRKHLYRRANE